MTSYLYSNTYFTQISNDKKFVLNVIDDLRRLLIYLPKGLYGKDMFGDYVYDAKAETTEKASLTVEGTVMFIYIQIFKEPWPLIPTYKQAERINEIWDAVGYPQNKIVL